jgi:hypothetical protein
MYASIVSQVIFKTMIFSNLLIIKYPLLSLAQLIVFSSTHFRSILKQKEEMVEFNYKLRTTRQFLS